MKEQASRFQRVLASLIALGFLLSDPSVRVFAVSEFSHQALAPQSPFAPSVEHTATSSQYQEAFTDEGFAGDFADIAAIAADKAAPDIRDIYYSDEDPSLSKEERMVQTMVEVLQSDLQVASIRVLNEATPRLAREEGRYSVVVKQENYDLIRKSHLSVGTLVAVHDRDGTLVGSFYFLNGPITVMVVTDGTRIMHSAHDGARFVKRSNPLNLSGETNKKTSTSTVGGPYSQWPMPFQQYFWDNGRSVPNSDGKTALKDRYSGVTDIPATAANFYEIMTNNGFAAEVMSAKEAKIWATYARGAGGKAMAMTPKGIVPVEEIPEDVDVVQLYAGNGGVVDHLAQSPQMRNVRDVDIPPLRHVSLRDPGAFPSRGRSLDLRRYLETALEDSPANRDLMGALQVVQNTAAQVARLYVQGGTGTGLMDSGDAEQKTIDLQTDQMFSESLRKYVWTYQSEEGAAHRFDDGRGEYWAHIGDPLDGSSKVQSNGGGGSIGAFLRLPKGTPLVGKTGREIQAAYFVTYGAEPKLVVALKGRGVHEFVLDHETRKFYFSKDIVLSSAANPEVGLRRALGGERPKWPAGFPELVDAWYKEGSEPGYNGAMVTDAYGAMQHIMAGGRAVFAYLADKLRVRYEEYAMAFIFEEAGGASLTHDFSRLTTADGNPHAIQATSALDRPLEEEVGTAQQKAPFALGDPQTIEEIKQALLPVEGRGQLVHASRLFPWLRALRDDAGDPVVKFVTGKGTFEEPASKLLADQRPDLWPHTDGYQVVESPTGIEITTPTVLARLKAEEDAKSRLSGGAGYIPQYSFNGQEPVAKSFIKHKLEEGVLVVPYAGLAQWATLKKGATLDDEPNWTFLTPEQESKYAHLIEKIRKSNGESHMAASTMKQPELPDLDRNKVNLLIQKADTYVLMGVYGPLHAASRFGLRRYVGEKTLAHEKMTPQIFGKAMADEALHHVEGDFNHERIAHDTELLAVLDKIATEDAEAFEKEQEAAAELFIAELAITLDLEKGIDIRTMQLQMDQVPAGWWDRDQALSAGFTDREVGPIAAGKQFLRLGQQADLALRDKDSGLWRKEVWESQTGSAGLGLQMGSRVKGDRTVDSLKFHDKDTIVLRYKGIVTVLKGDDFVKDGIPEDIKDAYDFENHTDPLTVVVLDEKNTEMYEKSLLSKEPTGGYAGEVKGGREGIILSESVFRSMGIRSPRMILRKIYAVVGLPGGHRPGATVTIPLGTQSVRAQVRTISGRKVYAVNNLDDLILLEKSFYSEHSEGPILPGYGSMKNVVLYGTKLRDAANPPAGKVRGIGKNPEPARQKKVTTSTVGSRRARVREQRERLIAVLDRAFKDGQAVPVINGRIQEGFAFDEDTTISLLARYNLLRFAAQRAGLENQFENTVVVLLTDDDSLAIQSDGDAQTIGVSSHDDSWVTPAIQTGQSETQYIYIKEALIDMARETLGEERSEEFLAAWMTETLGQPHTPERDVLTHEALDDGRVKALQVGRRNEATAQSHQKLNEAFAMLEARGRLSIAERIASLQGGIRISEPTGGYAGEGLPEPGAKKWIANRLAKGALFVTSDGTVQMGTLQGDALVRTDLSAEELQGYNGILSKVAESNILLDQVVKDLRQPKIPDLNRDALRRHLQETEVVIFPGKFLVAGGYSAHAARTFGKRTYLGLELGMEMSALDLAILRVEEALHHEYGDPGHQRIEHEKDHVAILREIAGEHKEIVDEEIRLAPEEAFGWDHELIELLKTALKLEEGDELRRLYLHRDNISVQQHSGTEFIRIGEPIDFATRTEDGRWRKQVWDIPTKAVVNRSGGNLREDTQREVKPLDIGAADMILLNIGDVTEIRTGRQLVEEGIPKTIETAYDHDTHRQPITFVLLDDARLQAFHKLSLAMAPPTSGYGDKPMGGYMTITGSTDQAAEETARIAALAARAAKLESEIRAGLDKQRLHRAGLSLVADLGKALEQIHTTKHADGNQQLAVVAINVDDLDHSVNIKDTLRSYLRDPRVRVILISQRSKKDDAGNARQASSVLEAYAKLLGLERGIHFHAAVTYEELNSRRASGEDIEDAFVGYVQETLEDASITAESIGYINSSKVPIEIKVKSASVGILQVTPRRPREEEMVDMGQVIGFTHLAVRIRQIGGMEHMTFADLLPHMDAGQKGLLFDNLALLGVNGAAEDANVMEFLTEPKPFVSSDQKLNDDRTTFKGVVDEA